MRYVQILVIILFTLCIFGISVVAAADPPHSLAESVGCEDCHTLHAAPGASLTNDADNYNLCMSCHTVGGLATALPFAAPDQAVPGTSGTSHNWTKEMTPADLGPNSAFGLRMPLETNTSVMMQKFSNVIVCSVCHQQHSQFRDSWNAFLDDSGTATGGAADGSTMEDTSKTWTVNQWDGYSVEMTSGPNAGERKKIESNTATVLTLSSNFPFFSNQVQNGDGYIIQGGNFQRADNDENQMCVDCHYYKSVASGQTDVRTYDGNKKSHPVGKNLTTDVTDPSQFVGAAPLDTNFGQQTPASRYHMDAPGESNPTNNVVLDFTSKVRCLSCHGMHYTDSDSSTYDQP